VWLFLTGKKDDIQRLAKDGFRIGVAEGGSPEEPIIHSSKFVLVDAQAQIRGYYDGDDAGRKRLIEDAALLCKNY
jgi:cytochrome oxidase Cu insertion factor (SCO1/SenC/PrrC family)